MVVEDGAWGGELRQLLKVAGCEHHLERFRLDQLDGEVLLMMERRDFARMGVTEVGFVPWKEMVSGGVRKKISFLGLGTLLESCCAGIPY